MNWQAIRTILDNEMLPTLWHFYGKDHCYFQDDIASSHVLEANMQWYVDNNVHSLDCPTQSSDPNAIKYHYDELDRASDVKGAMAKFHWPAE